MTSQAGIFTLGCFYKNHQEVEFMSMYGSVTDAQVFSRELSDQEMVDITSCRWTASKCSIFQGYLLSVQKEVQKWAKHP